MKKLTPLLILSALASGLSLFSQTLLIDDFNSYSTTSQMTTNVNSFGHASDGVGLALGQGVGGSNAGTLSINWGANQDSTNANFRRINLTGTDLGAFPQFQVVVRLAPRAGFDGPTNPTLLRLAIQGTNGAIWQTLPQWAQTPGTDGFSTLVFNLSDQEMGRVEGTGTLAAALANVSNVRLRFENTVQSAGQVAYVDSMMAIPEPATYAMIFGIVVFGVAAVVRRRASK